MVKAKEAMKTMKIEDNSEKRFYDFLSLAAKAGKLKSGEFSVEKSVKMGKAYLVIIAEDASPRTRKSYDDMCSYYNVDIVIASDKERLGRAIGKDFRVAVAVCDENFANGLLKYCVENQVQ